MSMLDRLLIRGIRNFGVDAEDEQKIVFTAPLTLILGANGCGKTTIIECIKYALTGKMPPNCKDGFIHDPCVANLNECLGQVKLKVQNIKGVKQTVTRSAKVIRKTKSRAAQRAGDDKEQLQFKTLDATGSFEDDNGHEHHLSKRCIDMDVEMCNAMGVSETIINNVLFCHQEESNWPLSTDQELKKKFDDIFGTSNYNVAIEKLRKSRKEYEAKAKNQEITLKDQENIRNNAETRNLELQGNETRLADLKESYAKYDADLEPIQKRINEIMNIERHISKLSSQKTEVETRYKSKTENHEQLIAKIKDLFDGPESQLDAKIRSFKETMVTKDMELNETKKKLAANKQQEQKYSEKIQENERKCIGFVHQLEQKQDSYAKKAENMREICKRLNIEITFDLENCNERSDELLPEIRVRLSDEEENITEIVATNEQVDYEQQTEIDKMREKRTQVESEISAKRSQITQLKSEHSKQQANIVSIERSAEKLKEISDKATKTKQLYDNLCANGGLEEIRKDVVAQKEERRKLSDEVEVLDEKIAVSVTLSSISSEISSREKQLEKRDSEMKRIKNKHSNNLRKLFKNESIESNYKQRLGTLTQKLRMETSKFQNDVKTNERIVNELIFNHRNKKQDLTRWENEARELDEKIYEQCQSTAFVEVLEKVKENVSKFQMEHGQLKSSELFFKKYIKKIEEEPCCPLCHKDMNNNEAGDLTAELNGQIELLPLNINRAEETLKEENRRLEILLALQPSVERLDQLKSKDIPELKTTLADINKKLSTAQAEKSKLEKSLEESTSMLDLSNSMSGDMSLLDEATKDVERIRTELTGLKGEMPDFQNELSIDELQKNRKTLAEKQKKISDEIDRLEQRERKETHIIAELKDKHLAFKNEEIKLKEGVQGLGQLKSRQQEITAQMTDLATKIEQLSTSLQPLKTQLASAIENKQRTKTTNAAKLKQEQTRVNEMKRYNEAIGRYAQEIRQLASVNLEEEIAKCNQLADKINEEKKAKAKEIDNIMKKIDALNADIAGQVSIERDLLDNKELMRIKREIEELKTSLDGLKKNFDDLDFGRLSSEKTGLLKKSEKFISERNHINGQIFSLEQECKRLKEILNDPKYKNAVKNYREAFYEHFVLKTMAKDLDQYSTTLDQILVKYHTEKMIKINRMIRELWRSIYRGNDIDYIEITTEEPKATNKRRNYTYRVVQSKNDVKIDMRGRCSAGQRVLACLIIRIALAETFSSNCGVLALDEPTTNLDRANILSLCEALNRIVEERITQSNFMLIVITHDEEFMRTLGRFSSYYRVDRNAQGRSVITKARIQ